MHQDYFFKIKEVRDGPSVGYVVEQVEPTDHRRSFPIPANDSIDYHVIDKYLKTTCGLIVDFMNATESIDGPEPGTKIRTFPIKDGGVVRIQDGPRVLFAIRVPDRRPSDFV